MNAAAPLVCRRELLRRATFAAHRSLDALASTLDFDNPPDFGRFLLANAEPLTACETALENDNVVRLLPDWPSRVRRHAIAQDLATLGLPAPATRSMRIESRSAQLGTLYVLEGSRLGARAILKNLRQSQDATIGNALRFLAAGDASCWSSFLQVLESASEIDADELTRSARATFDLFRESFTSLAPPENSSRTP